MHHAEHQRWILGVNWTFVSTQANWKYVILPTFLQNLKYVALGTFCCTFQVTHPQQALQAISFFSTADAGLLNNPVS